MQKIKEEDRKEEQLEKEIKGRRVEELQKSQRRKRRHREEEEEYRKMKGRSSKEALEERKLHHHPHQPMGKQEAQSQLPGPAPWYHCPLSLVE